ncbi:hypothetical protein KW477_05860 [Vibrio fluvialis]|nr:hypothetical protein [Vibrio fluvialis]MBY8037507.1 hypothetical protein [Vibrio fluvialis]
MLSIEERLAMLDEFLNETTPEKLFEELSQFEAVGPLAVDFLSHPEFTYSYDVKSVLQAHIMGACTINVASSKSMTLTSCESLTCYSQDLPLAA